MMWRACSPQIGVGNGCLLIINVVLQKEWPFDSMCHTPLVGCIIEPTHYPNNGKGIPYIDEWNATEWTTIRLRRLQDWIPLVVYALLLDGDIVRWINRALGDSEETIRNPTVVCRVSWSTCPALHLVGNTNQFGITQYFSITKCSPTLSERCASKKPSWREKGWDWRETHSVQQTTPFFHCHSRTMTASRTE